MLVADTSSARAALDRLEAALGAYVHFTGKNTEDTVRVKMGQLLLGSGNKKAGAVWQGGLFDLLAATAPKKGRVTQERRAAGWRMSPKSTSVRWARQRAKHLLLGAPSAAFRIRTGDRDGATYIAGVDRGSWGLRGKRAGQIGWAKRGKNRILALGVSAGAARAAGGVVLNLQALTVTLAIARREHSRLATAAQVLPSRYRTLLRRRPGVRYRSGNLPGLSSTLLGVTHAHDRKLIKNRTGRTLGSLEVASAPGHAWARVIGSLGLHTAAQEAAVAIAVDRVAADTAIYLIQKQQEAARDMLKDLGAQRG